MRYEDQSYYQQSLLALSLLVVAATITTVLRLKLNQPQYRLTTVQFGVFKVSYNCGNGDTVIGLTNYDGFVKTADEVFVNTPENCSFTFKPDDGVIFIPKTHLMVNIYQL